jgi:hypothetical protein
MTGRLPQREASRQAVPDTGEKRAKHRPQHTAHHGPEPWRLLVECGSGGQPELHRYWAGLTTSVGRGGEARGELHLGGVRA